MNNGGEALNDVAVVGNQRIGAYLKQVPIFGRLSDEVRAKIGGALKHKYYSKGAPVFRQGDIGDSFHIVKQGTAIVSVRNDEEKREVEVARLSTGDYFGETALLNRETRSATITAGAPKLVTLMLDSYTFEKIFGKNRLKVAFGKRKAISAEADATNGAVKSPKPEHAFRTKDADTKELIKDAVNNNVLFSQLDEEQLSQIVEVMWRMEVPAGHKLIKQGEAGDNFYVVESGEFEIFVRKDDNERMVATRGPAESFGELALMYNSPRAATVVARSKCVVWAVERYQFRKILMKVSEGKLREYERFLKSVPLLDALLATERQQVAEALDEITFVRNDVIVRQGDPGDTFYIIRSGKAVVLKSMGPGQEAINVNTLGPGDFFGERALMKNDVRAATVKVSQGPVECLCLDRDAFQLLLGPLGELMSRKIEDEYDVAPGKASAMNGKSSMGMIKRQGSTSVKKNIRKSDLTVIGTLGKGSFGHVQLVKDKENDTYALKQLAKSQVVQLGQQEHVMSEKNVMDDLDCMFLVNLVCTYKDRDWLYFLMEVCLGGELFSVLRQRTVFDEPTAMFFTGCVVEAFAYMHEQGTVYRDLKPENLLLDGDGYMKITDFGFAKKINNERTWTLCGTPDYLAPEVVSGVGHGKGVDWWTLGILIYEMLASYPPFFDEDPMKTYAKIMHGNISFPRHFSKDSTALIKKLLHPKATKRLGVVRGGPNMIRQHEWFKDFSWVDLNSRKMQAPIVPKIKNKMDLSNFEEYPDDDEDYPPYVDDGSGWDDEF